jgi:glycine cleavage system H lipoate-binding protein
VRYWLLSGQLMYIDLPDTLKVVAAGEPFAKILSGGGQTEDLVSPMTGKIVELNHQANAAMSALVRDNLCEGWLLWLARIEALKI